MRNATDVATDRQAIEAVVHDYFDSWFTGDAERMGRVLHPALAKRAPTAALLASGSKREGDPDSLEEDTRDTMVEATAKGIGTTRARTADERAIEVDVIDVHPWIATALVRSPLYREYLHLVRTSDGWRIANALWQRTMEGGDDAG
jgi:hypothetical protein